ncbi:MAG: hypothetical protein KUG77_19715 [Nannocystaceae bacterium]|nr:hypothetical protein [Nannocystaceae bacterium]
MWTHRRADRDHRSSDAGVAEYEVLFGNESWGPMVRGWLVGADGNTPQLVDFALPHVCLLGAAQDAVIPAIRMPSRTWNE